jgi:hypothetical protein
MKNVCYLHHNGFLIFEQRLLAIHSRFIGCLHLEKSIIN